MDNCAGDGGKLASLNRLCDCWPGAPEAELVTPRQPALGFSVDDHGKSNCLTEQAFMKLNLSVWLNKNLEIKLKIMNWFRKCL
jgi:hypothetical protein